MIRKLSITAISLAILVMAVSYSAFADGPDFANPAIYADGEMWATKGLNPFPAPNVHNLKSFDYLFVFTNGAEGQLPVAEAAPGNPDYNGGRWNVQTATWAGPALTVITSYAELQGYVDDGFLIVMSAGNYFECPLLPLK